MPEPAPAPATPIKSSGPSPATPTADATNNTTRNKEGYDDESEMVTLHRPNRIIHRRTVTITAPPPPPRRNARSAAGGTPPKKDQPKPAAQGGGAAKSTPSKETNHPPKLGAGNENIFDKILIAPIKDLVDHVSRQGERKKAERAEKESARAAARERLERVTASPIAEKDPVVAAEVVFVHGACGSSVQFDRLLESVHAKIRRATPSSNGGAAAADEFAGKVIRCHLFDSLGCGKSKHDPRDWNAYKSDELVSDLAELVISVASLEEEKKGEEESDANGNDPKSRQKHHKHKKMISRHHKRGQQPKPPPPPPPIFLVAHSYGTSQILHLLFGSNKTNPTAQSASDNPNLLLPPTVTNRIAGMVLISGALAGGPSDVPMANRSGCGGGGGGQCTLPFCLPTFVLKPFQTKMNDAFLVKAIHPDAEEEVVEESRTVCEGNDMDYCRAFYRQWRWATVGEAKRVKTKALVVHGEDDKVIVSGGGGHLNETLPNSGKFQAILKSGHQVMQERPGEVADLILDFIAGHITTTTR